MGFYGDDKSPQLGATVQPLSLKLNMKSTMRGLVEQLLDKRAYNRVDEEYSSRPPVVNE